MANCFVCGKKLGKHPIEADTRDCQIVYVGRECINRVLDAGEAGLQCAPGSNVVRVYPILKSCPECGSDNKAERLEITNNVGLQHPDPAFYPCPHNWHK